MNELIQSLKRLYDNEYLSQEKKEKIIAQIESLFQSNKISDKEYQYILGKGSVNE